MATATTLNFSLALKNAKPTKPITDENSNVVSSVESNVKSKNELEKDSETVLAADPQRSVSDQKNVTDQHKIKKLVIDSSALIQNIPVDQYGVELFSIPEIISEIRDKPTRARLQTLPYKIIFKEPSHEAILKASKAAKLIGDYDNLSKVDLRLVALALQLAEEEGCQITDIDASIAEAKLQVNQKDVEVRVGAKRNRSKKKKMLGWGSFKDDFLDTKDMEKTTTTTTLHDDQPELVEISSEEPDEINDQIVVIEEENESESDGENPNEHQTIETIQENTVTDTKPILPQTPQTDINDGWVTIEKIESQESEAKNLKNVSQPIPAACATCDFSMQNVLLKLGVNLVGKQGKLVKNVRSWALRCASCAEICHDMSKVFCPGCGHRHTLKRVPYVINQNGKKTYFLSKDKNPKCLNQRGTRYSIPSLKGGKHSNDPLLSEGQRINYDKASKKAVRRQNQLLGEVDDCENPFRIYDVSSRSIHKGNMTQRKKYQGGINDGTAQQMRAGVGVGNNKKKIKKGKKK